MGWDGADDTTRLPVLAELLSNVVRCQSSARRGHKSRAAKTGGRLPSLSLYLSLYRETRQIEVA